MRLVGRSFKYHRPRGIFTAGSEEPNALVELGSGGRHEPNCPATMVELHAGLDARSQNRWPNLLLDVMQVVALASPILVSGFYYKTFKGMPGWHFYERLIRQAAGLGRGTTMPDPDRYDRMHLHCDVLVVGGGPGGLAAALAAARSDARVVLIDEQDAFGGRLRGDNDILDDEPATRWVEAVIAELADRDNVTLLTRTTAWGLYDGNVVAALERVSDHHPVVPDFAVRQRSWTIRTNAMILATGATERPLVFGGNDRPGVMLASAARTYVNRFAVRPGNRAIVYTNNDDAYRTAIDLSRAGLAVRAVIDARRDGAGDLRRQVEDLGIECFTGASVAGTHGYLGLTGVDIAPRGASGHGNLHLDCDLLAVSGGWNPNIHLHSHRATRPVYDPEIVALRTWAEQFAGSGRRRARLLEPCASPAAGRPGRPGRGATRGIRGPDAGPAGRTGTAFATDPGDLAGTGTRQEVCRPAG